MAIIYRLKVLLWLPFIVLFIPLIVLIGQEKTFQIGDWIQDID